jgi:hypothetical protein
MTRQWPTIPTSLHPRKALVVTVFVFGFLGIALHAARTQEPGEGAPATGATMQPPALAGVVSSTQNPLQIALLHWYAANLTAQFPAGANPYGVAFDGQHVGG